MLLTEKQRDALNLLIQHKTSKQISRELRVSPHTVDQRIEFAKRKFGVATRGELAQAYLRWLTVHEQLTYEKSHIAELADRLETSISEQRDAVAGLVHSEWSDLEVPQSTATDYRVVPELFSGKSGVIYRLGAIFLIAVLMVITVLGGLTIFVTLTEIMGR
jgi:DNA-binding CsgD family transcriptional regulator